MPLISPAHFIFEFSQFDLLFAQAYVYLHGVSFASFFFLSPYISFGSTKIMFGLENRFF